MENPEYAAQMLTRMRELGAGLVARRFRHRAFLARPTCSASRSTPSRSTSRSCAPNAKGTRPVILRSIIALAHDLGMDVVAEGAETDSDAVELYQLGCEYAQGFVFGEPMSADQARTLITQREARDGAIAHIPGKRLPRASADSPAWMPPARAAGRNAGPWSPWSPAAARTSRGTLRDRASVPSADPACSGRIASVVSHVKPSALVRMKICSGRSLTIARSTRPDRTGRS